MRWLRVLIPSWRFFERPGETYRLCFRVDGGDWQDCPFPTVSRLFLNARGNLNLAFQGIVDGLAQNPGSLRDYELTCNLVREVAGPGVRAQFKVQADGEDMLVSHPFRT